MMAIEHNYMSDRKKNGPLGVTPKPESGAPLVPRRASRVVHDERGNARIEWIEESAGKLLEDRIPLELVDDEQVVRGGPVWNPRKVEKGWNPYQSTTLKPPDPKRAPPVTIKKDLRKLSEWIKLKREIEARKLRGDQDDGED
jgi:hypothetical protein